MQIEHTEDSFQWSTKPLSQSTINNGPVWGIIVLSYSNHYNFLCDEYTIPISLPGVNYN